MAISSVRLATLRRAFRERTSSPITWTKTQLNAAFQAARDAMNANHPTIRTDIETAVPGAFIAVDKGHIIDTMEETPRGE